MKNIKLLESQELVNDVVEQGSISEFLRSRGIHPNHTSMRKYIRDVFADAGVPLPQTKLRRQYDVSTVRSAFQNAICWSDVYRDLGVTVCDHNKKGILNFARHHGINPPEFTPTQIKQAFRRGKTTWQFNDIFCVDSKYARSGLRRAALRFGVFGSYVCNKCGVGSQWNGAPLTLELDHINGINNDNRTNNLRWLCPNCHSQTTTFKGKQRD